MLAGWRAAVLFVGAWLVGSAGWAAPADVARGLAWLQDQVQADGSLITQSHIARPARTLCEVGSTLVKQGGSLGKARLAGDRIVAGASAATETLGCVQALRERLALGTSMAELDARLLPKQGYAAFTGFVVPDALDSGWGVLASMRYLSAGDRTSLLAWLRSAQSPDGSFWLSGLADVPATAAVLRALQQAQAAGNADAAMVAAAAAQWLLAQRDTQGRWADDVATTAIAYEAVHAYSASATGLASAVETYLLGQQQADGSWAGDPFTTAVALRALALTQQTPAPAANAGLRLRVLDASTQTPVAGAIVELALASGGVAIVSQTDASGLAQFGGLAAQGVQVRVSKTGYAVAQASAQLVANQIVQLQDVQLQPMVGQSAPGTVSGVVRDAATGSPLAGAQVTLDPGLLPATTDAAGRFAYSGVPAGAMAITASKNGYSAASATASMQPGRSLEFNLGLQPVPVLTGPSALVSGIVKHRDGVGAFALQGAKLTLFVRGMEPQVQFSAADGTFAFPPVLKDIAVVQVEATGFKTAAQMKYLWSESKVSLVFELVAAPPVPIIADLKVLTVAKGGMFTDPATLAASGNVAVEVMNMGRADAAVGTRVLLFEDRDSDARYTASVDQALGSITLATPLAPGERRTLSIPVTGTLLFRDSAIYAFADSDGAINEPDEVDNIAACDCTAGMPFIEDFNDGVADGVREFPNQSGQTAIWNVRDGYLEPLDAAGGAAAFGDARWANYDAEVSVMFVSTPNNDAGLLFRVADDRNGFQFSVKDGDARILSIKDGVIREHASARTSPQQNRWYKLRVEVRGKRVKAFFDGQLLMTFDNVDIPRGRVGVLQDAGVRVRYDDLRVLDAPIFEEDFSGATQPFQKAYYGGTAGSVVAGELRLSGSGSAWAGDRDWTNYTAQVDVKFLSGYGNDAVFFVLAKNTPPMGSAGEARQPWIQLSLNNGLLRLWDDSGVIRAGSFPMPPDHLNTVLRYRAEVTGKLMRWYMNDQFLFEHEARWGNGAIGISQDGITASYDNFKVWRSGVHRPDLTASLLEVVAASGGGTRVSLRVGNGGHGAVSAGLPVQLYRTANGVTTKVGSLKTSRALGRGAYEDIAVDLPGLDPAGGGTLTAKVDEDDEGFETVFECNEDNNSMTVPLGAAAFVPPRVEVTTDKAYYQVGEAVRYTLSVVNPSGSMAEAGTVTAGALSPDGQQLERLPAYTFGFVPANGRIEQQGTWLVPPLLAGSGYTIVGALTNSAGYELGSATATFAIGASQVRLASTRVTADRASYSAAQSVQLTSQVANPNSNATLDNVQVKTEIRSGTGQVAFSRTESIAQLAPSGSRQFSYSVAASGLAAGSYQASLQLLSNTSSVLSQSTTSFSVLGVEQTGIGLTGSITAPAEIRIGEGAQLVVVVANPSKQLLSQVPVTLRVIDPASGAAVATYPTTLTDLAAGASRSFNTTWTAAGTSGQTLVVAASATVGSGSVLLGQANLRLMGVPKLGANPDQLAFTPIYSGESATRTVTVSSIGTLAAGTLSFTLTGGDASRFVIPQSGCTQTASLPIAATCTLVVSYRPDAPGRHTAQVQLGAAGAQNAVIALTGEARQAIFTATLGTDPAQVPTGAAVALNYTASNPSSATATLAGSLAVQDAGGQLLASWPVQATVAGRGSYAASRNFTAPAQPQTLGALVSQQVGTATVVLATRSFSVTQAVLPVQAVVSLSDRVRMLVLVSCGESGDDDDHDDHHNRRDSIKRATVSKGDSSGHGDDDDDHGQCVTPRAQAIAAYLQSLGVQAKIVTRGLDFRAELRCGTYNAYWISGGALKLDAQTAAELREAVWRGEALWVDGVHDARNHLLHPVAGVMHQGKLSGDNYAVRLATPGLYAAGRLATQGQPTRFTLAGGQAQAHFMTGGQVSATPAIVSHDWGAGRSLLFAFDLAAMLAADQGNATLRQVLTASLTHAASGNPTLTVGDLSHLTATITNPGTAAVAVRVQASVPAGLTHTMATPKAQLSSDGTATQASWNFKLQPGASRRIDWTVQALQAGNYSLPMTVHSPPESSGEAIASPVKLRVKGAAQLRSAVEPALQALAPTHSADKIRLSRAKTAAQLALQLHSQGQYEQALARWVAASDEVGAIGTADAQALKAARSALALAIEAESDALCIQQCGSAACQ